MLRVTVLVPYCRPSRYPRPIYGARIGTLETPPAASSSQHHIVSNNRRHPFRRWRCSSTFYNLYTSRHSASQGGSDETKNNHTGGRATTFVDYWDNMWHHGQVRSRGAATITKVRQSILTIEIWMVSTDKEAQLHNIMGGGGGGGASGRRTMIDDGDFTLKLTPNYHVRQQQHPVASTIHLHNKNSAMGKKCKRR